MLNDPLSNPGVTPASSVPPVGPNTPRLGEGEAEEGQRPFTLPKNPAGEGAVATRMDKPTPMEMIRLEEAQRAPPMPPQQLMEQMRTLHGHFAQLSQEMQQKEAEGNLTADHYTLLSKIAKGGNPELQEIAQNTGGKYISPVKESGESMVSYITRWINGSQETLQGAMSFLGQEKGSNPNPADYLRLQYAVQRATQRGELFASIVGASVSGIKTLMSMQLG